MRVRLKLYGVFRSAAKTNALEVEISDREATVRTAIDELVSREGLQGLKPLLMYSESSDPRPNALIMVSGREINALNGLETQLSENDEIALLPVAHGG